MSTDFATTIDIRDTPPLKRQQLLFNRFDILQRGQSFELVTDHDPRRLHDLLQIRSGDGVTWDYLEAGPAVWRVQIGKSAVATSNCCSGGACCG
jgi:uncharacterized protein (DUF2249 family)